MTSCRHILLGCLCAFGSEALFGIGYVSAKAASSSRFFGSPTAPQRIDITGVLW